MKIDSHQHYWEFKKMEDPSWIHDSMAILRKDFYPTDVYPSMKENGIEGCVAVQADQSEDETEYLLKLSETNDFIKGVVGWVNLCSPTVEDRLKYYGQFKKLKGFRHIVQAEKDDQFLLRKDFGRGISLLKKYNFTYDILIYPKHLKVAKRFVRLFPDQKFLIDHIAKPFIKEKEINIWREDIQAFRGFENVYCKVAGLVTEADWKNWKYSDFQPYMDVVLEVFGPERLMFGSDWPVCLPSATYDQVCEVVTRTTSSLSPEEKKMLWGETCKRFYNLNV